MPKPDIADRIAYTLWKHNVGIGMNAESVNKWLTLSANIGVVFGLILLLVELYQNSDLVRAQIHQSRSDTQVARFENRADTEHLAPLMEKFLLLGGFRNLSSSDELTPEELYRLRAYLQGRHQDYDNLFYQYKQGYLDEEYYQFSVSNAIRVFSPWWDKLEIFENSRRPYLDDVIRLIRSTE